MDLNGCPITEICNGTRGMEVGNIAPLKIEVYV
jgi:hypothetical protein